MWIYGLVAFLVGCFSFMLAWMHAAREWHRHSRAKNTATVAAFLLAGIVWWLFATEIALLASGHYRVGLAVGAAAKAAGAITIAALMWVVFAHVKRCPQMEDDTPEGT